MRWVVDDTRYCLKERGSLRRHRFPGARRAANGASFLHGRGTQGLDSHWWNKPATVVHVCIEATGPS